jgi:stearoyl-CoA desaturase (delta-9 desaturase)
VPTTKAVLTSQPPSRGTRALRWLFNDPRAALGLDPAERDAIDPMRACAFVGVHLLCLGVIWVGASPVAVAAALAFYLLRMFFITAFYHRYFSHRTFSASRPVQFVMALLGTTAGQRGPLWWAGHHREHHITSDTAADPHSPAHRGRFFSHTVWFLTRGSFATPHRRVRDWLRVAELRWLERVDWLPFVVFAGACYGLGEYLAAAWPQLGSSGPQMLVWGFGISTVVLYHATYTINSLCHGWGSRRFDTGDDSRNNAWLALLTLGEGWHNNHHHYPIAARQGFYWWELDLTWLGLRLLAMFGIVSHLKPVPAHVLAASRTREIDA